MSAHPQPRHLSANGGLWISAVLKQWDNTFELPSDRASPLCHYGALYCPPSWGCKTSTGTVIGCYDKHSKQKENRDLGFIVNHCIWNLESGYFRKTNALRVISLIILPRWELTNGHVTKPGSWTPRWSQLAVSVLETWMKTRRGEMLK